MWRVSECKGCGAEMVWARTARGKKMPLDAEPSRDGNFVLEGDPIDPETRRLPNDEAARYTGDKHTAHWGTCPNYTDFKRPRG